MIEICAGSKKLVEQETFLEYLLKRKHGKSGEFSWHQFRKYVKKMPTLEKFENSENQNMRNRNKYALADTVISKLSGHANSPARGSVRSTFLQKRFPKPFQSTWAKLLNPDNWKRLEERQNSNDRLDSRMRQLILKFIGNDDPTE